MAVRFVTNDYPRSLYSVAPHEKEAEAAFGLPSDWQRYAILPIGYPLGRFGPVRRVPLEEVVYADRWGQPFSG